MAGLSAEVISDIHLNMWKYTPEQISNIFPATTNTLILAGDIGDPDNASLYTALNIVRRKYKRVFYIPGNHEFYLTEPGSKKTPTSVLSWFEKLDTQWDNFHFFYRRNEVFDGVRILGTTGWSSSPAMTEWSNTISKEGKLDIDFLEKGLLHSKEPVLIVTHYPSTLRVIQGPFKNTIKQHDYGQDLERMYHSPLHTWIFGHIHQKHNFTIPYSSSIQGEGKVRILCNPYGYPGEIASPLPLPFFIPNSMKALARYPDDISYRTL